LIDPYIFCLPAKRDQETSTKFIQLVVKWSRVLREVESSTSENAVSALHAAGLYPTFDAIKDLISDAGIDSLSAVDVQNGLRVLSERSPYVEERIDIAGVSAEVDVLPAAMSDRLPTLAGRALKDVLASLAIFCRTSKSAPPDIGTVGLSEKEAIVEGVADLVETYDRNIAGVSGPIRIVSQSFDLVHDPDQLLSNDWNDICLNPERAIQHIYKTECRENSGAPDSLVFRFGKYFLSSIEARGIDKHPSILRRLYKLCAMACCGRISSLAGAKVHQVRESMAADAPQVVRANGDKKWRCMVSRKGAGYRLHYWSSPSGVELDEVLVESDV
ncbi:MAG TPA: hypothetical protein VGP07_02015, partial [Polyangia bacterium]